MIMEQPPSNYMSINNNVEDTALSNKAENNAESMSGSYSAAASPYWVPTKRQGNEEDEEEKRMEGFSPFVAFCFTINYILGAGFLTIPWAFVQSGLMLSSIMLIVSAIGSDIAKDFMLETMARAEAMVDEQFHWIKSTNVEKNDEEKSGEQRVLLRPQKYREQLMRRLQEESQKETEKESQEQKEFHKSRSVPSFQDDDGMMTQQRNNDETKTSFNKDENKSPIRRELLVIRKKKHCHEKYVVKERKFEVNALCRIFLGKRGVRIYTLVISLYMCGTLWAYTSVFASAMATAFPLFSSGSQQQQGTTDDILMSDDLIAALHLTSVSPASINYFCYAVLFGCIVVPLSCLELDEQVPLQVFLTGCRFLMFLLMIGTSAACAEDLSKITTTITTPDDGNISSREVDYFRFAGVANTLPILIFANIFHHSIPVSSSFFFFFHSLVCWR